MKPIFPSIGFLVILFSITILLVIISQKTKRLERIILSLIWVVYMCIILVMTLPPVGSNESMSFAEKLNNAPPWNLKPFPFLWAQFNNMLEGQSGAARQFLGNIVLFIPAGFFPPMLFSKLRKWFYFFLPGLIWSLFIEIMQLVLNLGNLGNRSFDTADIILNVLGAVIGFILYKIFFYKKHKSTY